MPVEPNRAVVDEQDPASPLARSSNKRQKGGSRIRIKVLISVDKNFGHEAMYVALSRARYEAKIITPDKDEMLATISQSRAKLSALDVTSEGISLAQANRRKKL